MFRLGKIYDDKVKSLADALPYAVLVEDGIVMTKSGGFLASWSFSGPDMASASASDLNALAAQVNHVLNRRGDGWHLWVNAYRTQSNEYPKETFFPDRTSKIIDVERAELYRIEGRHFETHHVLTLMYLEPAPVKSRVENYFLAGSGVTTENSSALKALSAFKAGVEDIERALKRLLSLRRLGTREVMGADGKQYLVCDQLSFFHQCITGEDVAIRLPRVGMYLDAYIGGEDMVLGWKPKIGNKHVRVVGILGFPDGTVPGMLDQLSALPIAYRFCTRASFLSQEKAISKINAFERNWGQKTVSLFSTFMGKTQQNARRVNSYALEMQNSAHEALHLAQTGAVKYLHYTACVVVMDEDRAFADESALEIAKTINELGFASTIESVNAVRAFAGSWPGEVHANKRRPVLHSQNLSHLLPLTGVWAGPVKHPSPMYPKNSPPLFYGATTGATPFRFSTHAPAARDVGHTAIIGPSGSGKSTLLGLMVAQHMRYQKAQAFVFDRGYSMFALAKAMEIDGTAHHYAIDERVNLGLCPLARIHESSAEKSWALGWIENMAALQGVPITPDDRREIANGISLLAGERVRSLTNLKPKIATPKIKAVLEDVIIGPLGEMLNSERDGLDGRPVQVFELEELMRMDRRYAVPVLQYLIHVIDRRVDGRPTMLVMDEAWTMLEDEYMAQIIRSWLKMMRKKNCSVIFGTQGLDDLANAPLVGGVVLQECVTKVFLPNFAADKGEAKQHYLNAGLSEYETVLLKNLQRQRDYFYTSPSGRRVFGLDLGPVALAFIGASSADDINRIRELAGKEPMSWPVTWLKERGVEEWGRYWRDTVTPDVAIRLRLVA